jgi:hypothetical protein
MAIRPDWNQDGNLEFFVVPENCNIVILEGIAASIQLNNSNGSRYYGLLQGAHFLVAYPNFNLAADYTNRYLSGGSMQIFITNNRNGIAFTQGAGHILCIAIIETGFDVELP